jgi:hypothetical protein
MRIAIKEIGVVPEEPYHRAHCFFSEGTYLAFRADSSHPYQNYGKQHPYRVVPARAIGDETSSGAHLYRVAPALAIDNRTARSDHPYRIVASRGS